MEYRSCKDCDHRHPHCHSDCPDYAEMKEEIATLAKAKERAWIGRTYTVGGRKSAEEHRKYLQRNKNRKEYR